MQRGFSRRANGRDPPLGQGFILSLAPAVWARFGQGITITGAGVSQWDDASGNARHLKQGTDASRPARQASGSILFDGTDDFLKCDAFTLAQPETVYVLFRQITWTNTDTVFDGDTLNMMRLFQATTTPNMGMFAGSGTAPNSADLALNAFGVAACVFNGAASVIQVNNGTSTVGTPGVNSGAGFTLGANGGNLQFGNIEVKEVIVFAAAHDAVTRSQVYAYLAAVGGL